MKGRAGLVRWGVFFVYFGSLSLILGRLGWNLTWLWLGALLGVFLLALDRLVYLFVYPHELTPSRVRQLFKDGRWREALELLIATSEERTRLFFQQALGQVILLLLGFYLLTSSGSLLWKGLALSANLSLLVKEWDGLLTKPEELRHRLFPGNKEVVSEITVRLFVLGATVVFFLLTFLVS